MIVSSVLPAYRLESFPIFNRAPVIRDKLPLRNAEYKARMIAAKMSKKLTSAPNTEQAWDFSLTYIFRRLKSFSHNLKSIMLTRLCIHSYGI